jgi:hypothetical protein
MSETFDDFFYGAAKTENSTKHTTKAAHNQAVNLHNEIYGGSERGIYDRHGLVYGSQLRSEDAFSKLSKLVDEEQHQKHTKELPVGKVTKNGSIIFEGIVGKVAGTISATGDHNDNTIDIKKPNNTVLKQDANGRVLEIQYEGGGKTKFEYFESGNQKGNIKTIISPNGTTLHRGKYGEWLNSNGTDSGIHNLNLNPRDGSYTYLDGGDHIVVCGTDGDKKTSLATREQFDQNLVEINKELNHTLFGQPFANGDRVNEIIKNMDSADRNMLELQYETVFGKKLTDDVSEHLNTADSTRANEYLNLAAMQNDAAKYIPNSGKERDRFIENMNQFLERAHQHGMTADEISRTFASTERLLEATSGKVSAQMRVQLAEQIMAQAAHPESVNQGPNKTCNVTDIEIRTWATHPAVMANMVADVSLNGTYTARDGKVITIPAPNFVPENIAGNGLSPDQQRSFASQLIQTTMINDIAQRESAPRYFSQIPITKDLQDGGYWTDSAGNILLGKDGKPQSFGVSFSSIAAEVERVTGSTKEVFANRQVAAAEGVVTFDSEEDLKNLLEQASKDGRFPIIFGVSDGDPVLDGKFPNGDLSKNEKGELNRRKGGHVVCIDSYDPETGLVHLDNSWGINYDKFVSVHELYLASN